MSFVTETKGTFKPNFLESEVGLVLKTHQIPTTMGTNGVVAAGTVFPSNDANAIGIVFQDVDVSKGAMPGSVMVAGRVLKDRLSIATTAATALKQIVIVDGPQTTR